MAIKEKGLAAGVSLVAAALSFILFYTGLDWFLIKLSEWQHEGRRMAYTFWADFRAIPPAIVISLVVLFVGYRLFRCRFES